MGNEALVALVKARREQSVGSAGAPTVGAEAIGPDLVGRWTERREILRSIRRVQRPGGHAEVRVLLGPAGQGKSRLLLFAAEVARSRGFRVVRGQVLRDEGLPFSPFGAMMDTVRSSAAERLRRRPAPRGLPARLLYYLELLRDGSPAPLLLLVDDLHAAERPALTVFRFLCRNLPTLERPVLLLAAARDDEPRGRPESGDFAEVLSEITRPKTGLIPVSVVPPLSAAEAREVAELTQGGSFPEPSGPAVAALVVRARGNPLFVVEGVRELQHAMQVADGSDAGRPPSAPVPPGLRHVLDTRLAQLPPEHRILAEACSLLEEEFSTRPLEALATLGVGGSVAEIGRLLEELVEPWAMLRRRGPGRFAFTHVLYQEALAERAAERREWALALAAWWERTRPDEAFRIAHLYRLARDPDRALPWFRRALDATLEAQAYGAVEGIVQGIREMVELRPESRAEFRQLQFALLERLWLGGSGFAESLAREVLTEPLSPAEEVVATCFLAANLVYRNPEEARRRLEELPRRFGGVEARRRNEIRGVVSACIAYRDAIVGDWEAGLAEAETAIRLLPRRSLTVWRLSALTSRSYCLSHLRRYRESLRASESTLTLLSGSAPSIFYALLLEQRATISALLGKPAHALKLREQAVRLSREVSNPAVLGEATAEVVLSQLQRGQIDRARRSLAELKDLCVRFGLTHLEPWAAYREGQILWRTGQERRSIPFFRAASVGFRALPRRNNALLPEAYLASLERNPRKVAEFRARWLEHETGIDAEEVSAIEPLRAGSPAFLP